MRLVAGGGPLLKGATMIEQRADFLAEYDWIRTGLMFEPRGHDVMSGSILYPPTRDDCDIAILFIETSGCLPMCGHGTIGTVTMAIENGLVTPKTPGVLKLDTPAGLVDGATTRQDGRLCREVRITNVPSFLHADGPDGRVSRASASSRSTSPMAAISTPSSSRRRTSATSPIISAGDLLRWSPTLRAALNANYAVRPSREPGDQRALATSCGPASRRKPEAHARNAVFYGDKAIDRSPCGTGTSARMAQWAAQGKLKVGDDFVHEIDHRLAVQRPGRGARPTVGRPRRPSSPRSTAGRA